MTTRKITAFLMCPATNGDASGGTPAASAASGGHIKKGAWMSAHEAALVGIAGWFSGGPFCFEDRSTAHLVEQEAHEGPAEEQEPEGGGGHGSGSVKAQRYLRESAGKHDHEDGATYPLLDAGKERQANGTEGEPRGDVVHDSPLPIESQRSNQHHASRDEDDRHRQAHQSEHAEDQIGEELVHLGLRLLLQSIEKGASLGARPRLVFDSYPVLRWAFVLNKNRTLALALNYNRISRGKFLRAIHDVHQVTDRNIATPCEILALCFVEGREEGFEAHMEHRKPFSCRMSTTIWLSHSAVLLG